MFPRRGNRHARLLEQLDRLFVHAEHRTLRIIRLSIGFQHFLHAGHEFAVRFRRDYPVIDFPPGHPVFLSVRRTVSWLIDSTISNVTTCSASSRRLQLENPGGGGPRRIAITFASCSPSSNFSRGGSRRGWPLSVNSNPCVTNRSRMFSTVWVRQSNASAIFASVQSGPSASAFSSTWAR